MRKVIVMLLAVTCNVAMPNELDCSGSVKWGKDTFPDELVLNFSGKEVEISGASSQISTFEGGMPYKVCSESKNEIEFEYSTGSECGKDHGGIARYGHLQKVLGSLELRKLLNDKPFIGNYKCKPTTRVLN